MKPKEVYEAYKNFKVPSLSEIREIASQHSKTSLVIVILLVLLLLLALQYIPLYQVAQFNITNETNLANVENSYRATLAQIFGGIAIAIGLYYTWRRIAIAEEDLKATHKNLEVIQEGQITERFTRAIDQLGAVDKDGNPAIEIRLGGIYALERIANESDKDYWPIIEILTAYVRKNSNFKVVENKNNYHLAMDIQTVMTVIGKRKYSFNDEEDKRLNLRLTFLQLADLPGADFTGADFTGADLSWAHLEEADFSEAYLETTNLENSNLEEAHFEIADLSWAYLSEAYLYGACLSGADFTEADLSGADFTGADFTGADLSGVDLTMAGLTGAKNLSVEQLSQAKTLYKAYLDKGLEEELRAKGYGYLLDDEPK